LFPRGGLEELVKSIDNIIKSKGVKQAQDLMKHVQVLNKHTKHGVDQRNLPRNTEIINEASEPTKPRRQKKKLTKQWLQQHHRKHTCKLQPRKTDNEKQRTN
jgi:pyruvate dehydrogenase complex dehydrogenase (E1) component